MNLSLDPRNSLSFLSLTSFSPKCLTATPVFSITYAPPSLVTTCVPYHLRDFIKLPQKSPSVFYHLQTSIPVTTSVPYHLQKTPGGAPTQRGPDVELLGKVNRVLPLVGFTFSRPGIRVTGIPITTFVMYHLRDFTKTPQKSPNFFYHLQTLKPVTTFVMYHLRKKPGGGLRVLVLQSRENGSGGPVA